MAKRFSPVSPAAPSGAKKLAFYAVLVVTSVVVAFSIAELVLRMFPMPGIELDLVVYDDLAGYRFYPNATPEYRTGEGVIRRPVNSLGYLDREHDMASRTEIKIGFFGDSYTESRQVHLEQTFFRLIEEDLSPQVETLAFGLSGFSTLQAYLTSKRWIDHFDIDLVVYVFVENDPGDQLKQIHPRPAPFPVLTESGLSIDTSFREMNATRNIFVRRVGDVLTSHSLVFATISQRLRLLLKYGPRFTAPDADLLTAADAGNVSEDSVPNENDPPSLWPDNLKSEALRVTEATIREWRDYVEQRGKQFAVFYIPRESELQEPTQQQDSWKPWLEAFLLRENIPFIDPTPELAAMETAGKQVFDDHFTPFGHMAAANSFETWLEKTENYGAR
jgi:hypothetical protein